MENSKVELDLLFETSWEVCNKVGGIYTVLSTKAKTLQKFYKDKVIFIGPDVWADDNPSPYFKECATPLKEWSRNASLPLGITARVGRWEVPGRPLAILVKFDSLYAVKDSFYADMWQRYGVDSLHAYGDYDEACAFSRGAFEVIRSIYNHFGLNGKKVIAHFDEWTTGMGLLAVKASIPGIATVFTTHATSIGRSICSNGKPLYDYFHGYNGDQMARELNMESKHSLEKTAAHQADCFTTVSELTAVECEQLLDIRPAVVTPNGFEKGFVPAKSKFEAARTAARAALLNMASSLTGIKYPDDTFILATSGRPEYRNKGLDLFIDTVRKIEERNPSRRVLALILVPSWVKEPRAELVAALPRRRKSRLDKPIITHWLNNPQEDRILRHIEGAAFGNHEASKVSLIFVPCLLDGTDGILNKSYYDLLAGFDATLFPSYYEPWGYTPLESIAFGVPTVTTNLSGFGQWIEMNSRAEFTASGVEIVHRTDSNYPQATESLAEKVETLLHADTLSKTAIFKAAMATASRAAWQYFITYYINAYEIALRHALAR